MTETTEADTTFDDPLTSDAPPADLDPVVFELVVPAHNEERYLERCIDGLMPIVAAMPCRTRVTVIDSGSSDATWTLAQQLAADHEWVRALREPDPGRGRALRTAWQASDASYVGYTDVDLSGDPGALPAMLELLGSGGADIVIGSRLASGAEVTRELDREVLSRGYSELLQWMAAPPFLDAQCGLKVMRADLCRGLLGSVQDEHWFFDTELLLLAWRSGARIAEAPISWIERRDSRVHVPGTVLGDLRGLARMSRGRWSGSDAASVQLPTEIDDDARIASARELAALGGWLLAIGLASNSPERSRRRLVAVVASATAIARPWVIRPRRSSTPLVNLAMLLGGVAACLLPGGRPGGPRRLLRIAVATRVSAALLRIASLQLWVAPDGDRTVDPARHTDPAPPARVVRRGHG